MSDEPPADRSADGSGVDGSVTDSGEDGPAPDSEDDGTAPESEVAVPVDSHDGTDTGDSAATDDDVEHSDDDPQHGDDSEGDTNGRDGMEGQPELRPAEVDRIFSLMEHAIGSDALEGAQLDRLLSVLERAVANSSETDPETVAELVSLLEELIVEPDDLDEVDVDSALAIFEEALAESGQWTESEDVLEVMADAIRDPTRIDPDDVERFRSGIENAIVEMTGSQGLGQLFTFPESVTEQGDATEGEIDTFRIARLAAGMTQRATGYSLESGIRSGTRMAYAAANAQSPAELVTETRAITLDELQRTGVDVGSEQSAWLDRHDDELVEGRPVTTDRLRERGEQLLSKSAQLERDESVHPAFASILDEVTPDEARLLRLLATEGPQPSLDVYDKKYIPFKSSLVAENLTRMGGDAGCRAPERMPMYLANLQRLGLVAVRDDPVEDLKRYQVLEAQPHIEAARAEADRPKTTYGAVHLTDFGIEFCETCLPVPVSGHQRTSRLWDDAGE